MKPGELTHKKRQILFMVFIYLVLYFNQEKQVNEVKMITADDT